MKKLLRDLVGWALEIALMTLAMMYPWQAFIGLVCFLVGLPLTCIILAKIMNFLGI